MPTAELPITTTLTKCFLGVPPDCLWLLGGERAKLSTIKLNLNKMSEEKSGNDRSQSPTNLIVQITDFITNEANAVID